MDKRSTSGHSDVSFLSCSQAMFSLRTCRFSRCSLVSRQSYMQIVSQWCQIIWNTLHCSDRFSYQHHMKQNFKLLKSIRLCMMSDPEYRLTSTAMHLNAVCPSAVVCGPLPERHASRGASHRQVIRCSACYVNTL